MRIALDGRTLGPHFPGIGRHVHGLAHALTAPGASRLGHELFLLVDGSGASDRWGSSEIPGYRTIGSRSPMRIRMRSLPRPPRRLASRWAFDLFHATHFAAAASLSCRTVVTVYDLIPHRYPFSLSGPLRRLSYRFLLKRAVRSADRVLTLTEAVKMELVEHLGLEPDRIAVTSAAVDPGYSTPTPQDIERVRRRYGLADRYVLNVSTLRPHKNRRGLLSAWRRVVREIPSAELVLLGSDESSFSSAEERDRNDCRIRDLGKVPEDDLWPLYGGAEVYAHPSLAEGFGLPVLEAMTCGIPVSCSEIPVLAEVTGDAAIRFDPRDPAAMASSLIELLSSAPKRAEMARRSREQASQFRWREVAERTWAAYESVLSLGRKAR